jgi:hypothetical protein
VIDNAHAAFPKGAQQRVAADLPRGVSAAACACPGPADVVVCAGSCMVESDA